MGVLNVIHNRSKSERFKNLMDELQRQGIEDVTIWDAIHDARGGYFGINKAHKQIVRWAKEEGLGKVIIAEDDLQFFDTGAWQYYIDNEPENYDLYLGGVFLGTIGEDNKVGKFTGLTLYTVSSKYYDCFLESEDNEHLDIALGFKGGDFYVCDPFVVRQYNGYSQNEKRYMNYDFMFKSRKTYKNA